MNMNIRKWIFCVTFCLFFSGQLLAAVNLVMTSNPKLALPSQRVEYTLTVTNSYVSSIMDVVVHGFFSE